MSTLKKGLLSGGVYFILAKIIHLNHRFKDSHYNYKFKVACKTQSLVIS